MTQLENKIETLKNEVELDVMKIEKLQEEIKTKNKQIKELEKIKTKLEEIIDG